MKFNKTDIFIILIYNNAYIPNFVRNYFASLCPLLDFYCFYLIGRYLTQLFIFIIICENADFNYNEQKEGKKYREKTNDTKN